MTDTEPQQTISPPVDDDTEYASHFRYLDALTRIPESEESFEPDQPLTPLPNIEQDTPQINITTVTIPLLNLHTIEQFNHLYNAQLSKTPQGAVVALLIALFIFTWSVLRDFIHAIH